MNKKEKKIFKKGLAIGYGKGKKAKPKRKPKRKPIKSRYNKPTDTDKQRFAKEYARAPEWVKNAYQSSIRARAHKTGGAITTKDQLEELKLAKFYYYN